MGEAGPVFIGGYLIGVTGRITNLGTFVSAKKSGESRPSLAIVAEPLVSRTFCCSGVGVQVPSKKNLNTGIKILYGGLSVRV